MAAAVALADRHYKVVIVGSGLSALQTARSLIDSYRYDPSSILLLEANDYVGGRVKQSLTFVEGVPVDLGAEILHGGNTLLAEYAKTIGEEIEQIYCWAHGGSTLFRCANPQLMCLTL